MPANVTPFLGVWIEIKSNAQVFDKEKSLPSWECGLKSLGGVEPATVKCHSLLGSVD